MIERYTRPEMGRIFSDECRFRRWLDVELAALEVRSRHGEVPADALATIRAKVRIDAHEILEIEKEVQHDVIAFVSSVSRSVGPEGRYIHQGMTSSDVLDTALSLQIQDAFAELRPLVDRVIARVKALALQHKGSVMIGRTHGVHAEPTTFGLKLAIWYQELKRARCRLESAAQQIRVGKISGAVGTYPSIAPSMEVEILAHLGLEAAPISNQVVQRDRHATVLATLALLGSSIDKFATEIRHLARTEVREVEEPFTAKQKGSSAMPHKRNPIRCERLCGLARILRANALVGMENVALWHERDISHSSAERVVIPDSFIAAHYMLGLFEEVLDGLRVNPDRMRRNLESTRGLVHSGKVLTTLTENGMNRDLAYRLVQEHAMRVWEDETLDFRQVIEGLPEVKEKVPREALDRCFDLGSSLRHLDESLARALDETEARS